MRIYIFKSERTKELRAFAGDAIGTKLPENHAPWTMRRQSHRQQQALPLALAKRGLARRAAASGMTRHRAP